MTPVVRKVELQKIEIHSLNIGQQKNSSWRGGVDRVGGTRLNGYYLAYGASVQLQMFHMPLFKNQII